VTGETKNSEARKVTVLTSHPSLVTDHDLLFHALIDLLAFYDRKESPGWVHADIQRLEEIRKLVQL
jgi:hypothetical protein